MNERITKFDGRWTRLSNYAACSIWFDDHIYPSVEHAYQAAKAPSDAVHSADLSGETAKQITWREYIRHLPTANQSKKAGRVAPLRKDWEDVKIDVMRELLQAKFAQEPDRTILLSTGSVDLVEGNWWGDRFWGQSPLGNGANWLGILLMQVRTALVKGEL